MTLAPTRPRTAFEYAVEHARRQFGASTDQHAMTVLLDNIEHRHLRFASPGTGIWAFEVITWPGRLVFTGDIGHFVFGGISGDPLAFFADGTDVHPTYWAEKVLAGKVRTDFSDEVYVETVREARDEAQHSYSPSDYAAICAAIDTVLLDSPAQYLDEARQDLDDFRVWFDEAPDFTFNDSAEWNLGGYDHHYLLACHALRYAALAGSRP